MPTPLPLPDSWDAEEHHLAAVYQLAEEERAATVAKLQAVLAQSGGTPQARSERESYNALYTSQIRAIDESQAGLCFGRIDIVPEAIDDTHIEAEATRYIGRMGLLDNDHDCRPMLVDWRAPLSTPLLFGDYRAPGGGVAPAHYPLVGPQTHIPFGRVLDAWRHPHRLSRSTRHGGWCRF